MGEIPPRPSSMQQIPPEQGKEIDVYFTANKEDDNITIATNLPNSSEIFIWSDKWRGTMKYSVSDGKIIIENASEIKKILINSVVFTSDKIKQDVLGEKCRNLVGEYIKDHPVHGNMVHCSFELD